MSEDGRSLGEPFQLAEPPLLSRSTVDRLDASRRDDEALTSLWDNGKVLIVDRLGRTPVVAGGSRLALRQTLAVAATRDGAHLLGESDGVGYWSVQAPRDLRLRDGVPAPAGGWSLWPGAVAEDGPPGEEWHDLRGIGSLLDDMSAGLLTTAVALANWHARARFCAKCGSAVEMSAAGWATVCTGCRREEYPRTDPAVICLVHDSGSVNGSQVLLARQPIWPPDRYSVLAGFVEAGESLESCVVREVLEEVGVEVSGVRYLGSQPWPSPRSIMIAFAATADPATPLRVAEGEIEHARWFSRAEVRAALDAGGDTDTLKLPGPTSIARQMIAGWALA